MFSDNVLGAALAAGGVVKLLVDMARMAAELPKWIPPLLALVLGPTVVLVIFAEAGTLEAGLTMQLAARAVLAGWLGAGQALAIHELGKKAHPTV